MSGVFRQAWGKDGSMYVGQTSRGWGATGRAQYGLQRLVWTGKTPFEPHHVSARPDGFEMFFTAPVDRAAAGNPASWGVTSFTYKYHHIYGSPVINQGTHAVRAAVVSKDGRSVRIAVDSLRQGYVHEIRMSGVRAAEGRRAAVARHRLLHGEPDPARAGARGGAGAGARGGDGRHGAVRCTGVERPRATATRSGESRQTSVPRWRSARPRCPPTGTVRWIRR